MDTQKMRLAASSPTSPSSSILGSKMLQGNGGEGFIVYISHPRRKPTHCHRFKTMLETWYGGASFLAPRVFHTQSIAYITETTTCLYSEHTSFCHKFVILCSQLSLIQKCHQQLLVPNDHLAVVIRHCNDYICLAWNLNLRFSGPDKAWPTPFRIRNIRANLCLALHKAARPERNRPCLQNVLQRCCFYSS